MSPQSHQKKVVAALRNPPATGSNWTLRSLEQATGLLSGPVRQAVRALRNTGKIDFTNLVLSPSMIASGLSPLDVGNVPDCGDSISVPGTAVLGCDLPGASISPVLPSDPTGEDCYAAMETAAAAAGIPLTKFVKPLLTEWQGPAGYLEQVRQAKRPRRWTVDRIRALITGAELPPVPTAQLGERVRQVRREPHMTFQPDTTLVIGEPRVRAGEFQAAPATESVDMPTPSDAIREAVARWPNLWARVKRLADDEAMLPGAAMIRALEEGLDAMGVAA